MRFIYRKWMWHFLSNMVVAISVDTKYAEFLFFHTIQLLRLRKERKREREKKSTHAMNGSPFIVV